MDFDLLYVYTAVNARELKPGDKVIVADDLAALRQRVEEYDGDIDACVIKRILNENAASRFDVLDYEFGLCRGNWLLAYLLERKDNCYRCRHYRECAEPKMIRAEELRRDSCPKFERNKKPDCSICKNREECDIVLGKDSDRTGCEEFEPRSEK